MSSSILSPRAAALSWVDAFTLRMRRVLIFLLAGWVSGLDAAVPSDAPAAADARTFVEFAFRPAEVGARPFAQEWWAEIRRPDGTMREFPAFFDGDGVWRVRVRAETRGEYRLQRVRQGDAAGQRSELAVELEGGATRVHDGPLAAPAVRRHPTQADAFQRTDGAPYYPVGLNVAWARDDAYYRRAFAALRDAGANWVRLWVVSWGELDPAWREEPARSPAPGKLDLEIARRWDRLLADAEEHGLYVQVVLFQHGQFSTEVNPSWPRHPWNKRNGGFLADPAAFFTDARALRETRLKLRYFAARYGHSAAVLAWELFNEVHYTDAWKRSRRHDAVVRWHTEMADYLRRHDPHGHLVTTSAEDLASPLWRAMDYYQPHLYAVNGLAHARRFPGLPLPADKPVFYGEIGDDHQAFAAPEDKMSGAGLVPPLWAGLMAAGALPAQLWYWDRVLDTPRWEEFAAWSRFVAQARLAERTHELREFQPEIRTAARVPQVLIPGFHWAAREPLTLDVAAARDPLVALADLPEYVVPPRRVLLADGHPDRVTLVFDRAAPAQVQVRLKDVGERGATIAIERDGDGKERVTWPREKRAAKETLRPGELAFAVPAGRHAVTLRNLGPDSFRIGSIHIAGEEVTALAAIGRRSATVAMVYLWHREGVMAAAPTASASGEVVLDAVDAGRWRILWWDMERGVPAQVEERAHAGGALRVATPEIARHAAVLIERVE